MNEESNADIPKMSLTLSMNEILAMLAFSPSSKQTSLKDLQKQLAKIIVFFAEKFQELEERLEKIEKKL